MSDDLQSIEDQLKSMRAHSPCDEIFQRFESCIHDSWTSTTPCERALEHELRAVYAPSPLPHTLAARLESVFEGVPFPADGNVITFPARKPAGARRTWAAAASVALAGAISALLLPTGTRDQQRFADIQPATRYINLPSANPGLVNHLVPTSFHSNLNETSEEGVMWQDGRPQKILKVTYHESVTLKDENGRLHEVTRPRVQYILAPAQVD